MASGAACLGHHLVGQRLRGVGQTTIFGAGQGSLVSVGRFITHWYYQIRGQSYKTFYDRNLRIFVISLSVCPWQA
jgi:hypothetical protein